MLFKKSEDAKIKYVSLEILYDTWFKKSMYENKKIKIHDITVAQMDALIHTMEL